MKKLKYILTALLVMVCVCVPFALTGCAKHYKINVSIAEGAVAGNDVKLWVSQESVKSVVGENEVEKGTKFVYSVCPGEDYEIFYIKEDGVTRYHAEQPNNEFRPDEGPGQGRIIKLRIDNVNADHTITVAFRLRTYSIQYMFKNPNTAPGQPAYLQLTNADGSVYKTEGAAKQNITIQNFGTFGFKYLDGADLLDFPVTVDTFPLMSNYVLYTDKTEAELKALLGIV